MSASIRHLLLPVLCVALVAFFGSLVLLQTPGIYVSPDETANAYFATQFAQTGTLSTDLSYPNSVARFLGPRSTVVLQGELLPASFVGLPVLFGTIGRFIGLWAMPLLTPLVALGAVVAWWLTLRKVASERVALAATVLLAVHPAWWYYSARVYMHNVLFASLLIFALFFVVVRPVRHLFGEHHRLFGLLDWSMSGALLSLALFVRASEVYWVVAVVAMLLLWFRAQITWKEILSFCVGTVLFLLPLFGFNHLLYGHPLATGYTVGSTLTQVVETGSAQRFTSPLFPFGMHPSTTMRHLQSYFAGISWWLTLGIMLGVVAIWTEGTRQTKMILGVFAGLVVWLGLMYGSWTFHDNPDPTVITIGNSYVRYWIPLFVLGSFIAAVGFDWLITTVKPRRASMLLFWSLLFACGLLGAQRVFLQPQDGLLASAQTLKQNAEIRRNLLALIEPSAVVITDRADKIFFPYRMVRQPLRTEATYDLMPELLVYGPLYYYGITFPEADMRYLNTEKLPGLGLQIEAVETTGIETLYRIEKIFR